MTKPTLPKGIYPQIYRGAITGATQKEKIKALTDHLDLYKSLGIPGILMHGFTGELDVKKFQELEALCEARGLLCIPAYGLDSSDPTGKGQRMGAVAAASKSKILVLDAEGAWENELADKQHAVDMGKALRAVAPNVLILDQPWPVPTLHSSFPWEEFAAYVDMHAAQWYYNDFGKNFGQERYSKCNTWFSKSWTELDKKLTLKGLVRPEILTIQGYGWETIFPDLIHCLTSNETLIIWVEPWLSDTLVKGVKVKNELTKRGFVGTSAVYDFQISTNGLLTADNSCGPKTLTMLGF